MKYTHKITWKEYNDFLGMFVVKSFQTTPDMVDRHVASIKAREYDKNGDQMIAGLKVELI